MAKASHLLNKSGGGGLGPMGPAKDSIDLNAPTMKDDKSDTGNASVQRPDRGPAVHAPSKAQGGGGQSSSRPKV